MRRRLRDFVTVVSLLLCLAVGVMWVRGHLRTEYFWHDTEAGVGAGFASSRGQLRFYLRTPDPTSTAGPARAERWRYNTWKPPTRLTSWVPGNLLWRFDAGRLGFHAWSGYGDTYWHYRMAIIPCWPAMLVAASPLPWHGVQIGRAGRARRRRAANLCPACGYDLRATPGSCPECGHRPAGAKA